VIKEAMEKVESYVKDTFLVKVGDRDFSSRDLKPVIWTPLATTLTVHTLSGITDYVGRNIDTKLMEKQFIHVLDVATVSLVSSLVGDDRRREKLLECVMDKSLESFPFGKFMAQEEFAIKFRSLIEKQEGDDSEYVLTLTSKLSGGTAIETADDGITQKVEVSRGIKSSLKTEETTKAIVKLAPFRTFREIPQVKSDFLLRIRLSGDDEPQVALFEADGGSWRHEAILRIGEYFRNRFPKMLVIA